MFTCAAIAGCGSSGDSSTFDAGDGIVNFGDAGTSPPVTLDDGGGGGPGLSGMSGTIQITIRDFKFYDPNDSTTNPDFEHVPQTDQSGAPNPGYSGPWDDPKIVDATLGADGKPVYANATGTTLTTHGKASFDQWYRDVPGTNINVQYPLTLAPNPDGSVGYDSEVSGVPLGSGDPTKMFFPIDDGTPFATKFGNQGKPHNYSFTAELHTVFTYKGGETFRFRGDDDVFVFINNQLVINLGGIHGPEPAQVSVDTLSLTKGNVYPLDFFSVERHVTGSNIQFTTTLGLRAAPPR